MMVVAHTSTDVYKASSLRQVRISECSAVPQISLKCV